jgi:hypothetical protein
MNDESQSGESIHNDKNSTGKQNESKNQNAERKNPDFPINKEADVGCIKHATSNCGQKESFLKWIARADLFWKKRKETIDFLIIKPIEILAFVAAIILAVTAVIQIRDSRTDRNLDERAWVAVRQGVIQDNRFPNTTFKVIFKNTGKTPAINVSAWMNQGVSTNSIPEKDQPMNPTNTFGAVQFSGLLAPDAEGSISVNSWFLDFDTIEGIRSGKKPYYIYGTIRYDDIFRKHHWSQFCYQVRPMNDPIEFQPINIHNSCDDAQTNQNN